jgi:uncharacterized GH25 family protein
MSPIAKAAAISAAVFVVILAAAFFILGRKSGGPDVELQTASVEEAPGATSSLLESARTVPIEQPIVRDAVTLTIEVLERGRKRQLQGSRAMVVKAGDGDRATARVWESGKDISGRWEAPVVPGAYQIRVSCPRYKSESRSVTVIKDQPQAVVFELERGNCITGRVIASGGKPIGGARVLALEDLAEPGADLETILMRMIEIEKLTGVSAAEDITQDDGTFSLCGLEIKAYTIRAVAAGYSAGEVVQIPAPRAEVEVVLQKGGDIGGTVTDVTSGGGVAEAVVKAYREVETQDVFEVIINKARPAVDSATSDASGRFLFKTLGPGLYNFAIEAQGYQDGEQLKVRVKPGDSNALAFKLKPGLRLQGVVLGPEGEPIQGAKVRASSTQANAATRKDSVSIKFDDGSVQTNEAGEYSIDTLEEGPHMVICFHQDYQTLKKNDVHVRAGMDAVDFRMTNGGRLKGTVVDKASGKPIAGARLSSSDMADLHKDAITAEDGTFVLAGLTAGARAVSVNVVAPGYARVRRDIKVEDNREREETFELEPTGVVAGRVVTSGGDPVPNARVMARKSQESGVEQTLATDITDKEGKFSLLNVEAGDGIWVRVKRAEFLDGMSEAFNVSAAEPVDVGDVVLQMGGSLSGVVLGADGKGLSGAMVTVAFEGETELQQGNNPQSPTNARGEFLIQGLRSGTVDLVAKASHFLETRLGGVEVKEGQVHRDIKIQLEAGNSVAGVVLDSNGRPVANAEVTGKDYSQGVKELRSISGSDGRFTVEGIVAADFIELEVSHDSYVGYSNQRVKVGTADLQVTLKELGMIHGRVLTPDGKPVDAFTVQATNPATKDPRKQPKPQTYNPTDGTFELRGVQAGSYTVSVRAPQYSAATVPDVQVAEGQTVDLGDISLQAGGIVTGTVIGSVSKAPVEGARVQIVQGSSRFMKADPGSQVGAANPVQVTGRDGSFTFSNLKGGTLSLRISHDDHVTRKVDDVNPDIAEKSQGLVVELDEGGSISGVVLDPDGNPKAGIGVYLISADQSQNQQVHTDKEGRYSFQGVAPGSFTVKAHKFGAGGAAPEQAESVVDLPTGGRKTVDLQLE